LQLGSIGFVVAQSSANAEPLLNNREWTSLFWLAVLLVFMVSDAERRSSFAGVLRAAAQRSIVLSFIALGAWVWLEVRVGSWLGWWSPVLLKDTLVWFLTTAIALLFSFDKATKEERFFRRMGTAALKVTVFVEVFVNLYVFNVVVEVLMQPLLVLLVGVTIVAHGEKEEPARRVAEWLLAVLGFVLFGYVAFQFATDWRDVDGTLLAQQFALPVWLTLGVLPFIYGVALYSAYEQAFMRIDWKADVPRRQRMLAKLALVVSFHVKARELSTFTGPWQFRISEAQAFRAARAVVHEFREAKRAEDREAAEAELQLVRYTGVDGADDEGRQLDRREFEETIEALRWLGSCMMGWYRHDNRYVSDLLERFQDDFTRQGLPKPSAITLRVSDDGQSWYAWRRTVTGWVFAIGAAGPPPDQWEYDGPEPPTSFPGQGRSWVSTLSLPSDGNRNW
jgi:hypothetical protein